MNISHSLIAFRKSLKIETFYITGPAAIENQHAFKMPSFPVEFSALIELAEWAAKS